MELEFRFNVLYDVTERVLYYYFSTTIIYIIVCAIFRCQPRN